MPGISSPLFKGRSAKVNLFVAKKLIFFSKEFVGDCAIAYIHRPLDDEVAKITMDGPYALNLRRPWCATQEGCRTA